MRLELGEITEEEFAEIEKDLLARIRDVRERNTAPAPPPGEVRIAGVEATFTGDEHEEVADASAGVETVTVAPAMAAPSGRKRGRHTRSRSGKGEAGHGRRR
jgi:hypothetical protein